MPETPSSPNQYGGVIAEISAARAENLDERGIPKNLGPQFRAMERTGYDADAHTVSMALSSDKPVERWYGTEILSHEPGAIRQGRLKQGIALLFNHDMDQHLGVSVDYEISGGTLRTTSRFGENPLALMKELDVRTNILKDVSVGYMVYEWKVTEDKNGVRTMKAIDWEPFEGSLVTVPADAKGSGVGRNSGEGEVPVKYTFRKLDDDASDPDDEDDDDEDEDDDEEDESERTTTPEAKRTITMAVEATVDLAAANKTRIEGLRALHQSNPTHYTADNLARDLFDDTVTPIAAKEKVMDAIIAGSQRSNVATLGDDVMGQLTGKEQRSYSLRNLYCAAINQRSPGTFKDKDAEAGLELEVSEALRTEAGKREIMVGGGPLLPSATTRSLLRGQPERQQRTIASGGNFGTATNFVDVDANPIELLRPKTVCLKMGAQMMTGLKGAMRFTRQTGAGQSNWLLEGGTVTETDPTFDNFTMTPKRLSMYNNYYLEALAQSAVAIESTLAADRMNVLARSLDNAGLAGPGTNGVPLGLLNQTGIAAILTGTTRAANGTVTPGAGGVPLTYVDINNFEAAIASQDGDIGTLGWVFTPRVKAALRSIPKISGGLSDFIWPSQNATDASGTETGPLGIRTATTSTTALTGFTANSVTGLHAAILGVWDQMLFGDWGLSELIVDPYTGAQQGLYKITEHGLYDTNIRHFQTWAISTSVLPS